MRGLIYGVSCLLALAACSTTEELAPPSDGGSVDDGGGAPDASSDAPAESGFDAARPLACGDAGFCETELPTSRAGLPLSLRSVWSVAANDVWSVSVEGIIVHFDGRSWSIAHEANHALYSIWATATDVWAGGEGGLLLHKKQENGGAFEQVETNHLETVRSIFGTSADDVWFTSREDSLDHYDGQALSNLPLAVPGLRVDTVFGRSGASTFAAGHVEGPPMAPDAVMVEHVPYVFELTRSGATRFNAALSEQKGLVPVSGLVTDDPDETRRVWLFGYLDTGISLWGKYTRLGRTSPVVWSDLGYTQSVGIDGHPPPLIFPAWAPRSDSVYVPYLIGRIYHFAGAAFEQKSLNMGYGFVPKPIFGMHGTGSDAWIVGESFALKGVAP